MLKRYFSSSAAFENFDNISHSYLLLRHFWENVMFFHFIKCILCTTMRYQLLYQRHIHILQLLGNLFQDFSETNGPFDSLTDAC